MSYDLNKLACPRDASPLTEVAKSLRCQQGHQYPIYDGIPVFLLAELPRNTAIDASLHLAETGKGDRFHYDGDDIHPQVSQMVAATNGLLYAKMGGQLKRYPIPELRLEAGDGKEFLDVGCNWGRWVFAAASRGYKVTGIDPHLHSLLAARVVARQLGIDAEFICGDARAMPFRTQAFDVVFSYSVVQHFSRSDARDIIQQMARVLRNGGTSFVQMPNALGLRSFYHLARRGFSDGKAFDVRYWTPFSIRKTFSTLVGTSRLSVDGFFGLGIQPSDIDLMPFQYRAVIRSSELLRRIATVFRPLQYFADSLYVTSSKSG